MTNSLPDAAVLSDACRQLSGRIAVRSLSTLSADAVILHASVTAPAATLRLTRVPAGQAAGRQAVLKAYDQTPAGSMLVIQTVGDTGGAVLGDIIAHRLKKIGVAGVLVDGAIRDTAGIRDLGLAVWARRRQVAGMLTGELAVEVGVTLTLDGIDIAPGDLVAANADGMLVVPAADGDVALAAARRAMAHDAQTHCQLAEGSSLADALLGEHQTEK